MNKPPGDRDTKTAEASVSRNDVGQDNLEELLEQIDKNNYSDGGVEKILENQVKMTEEKNDSQEKADSLAR